MKKIILLGTILIAGLTSVKAQSVDLIPKIGINFASQSASALSGEKTKTGFTGGVALDMHFKESAFSLQPELNFVSRGLKFKDGNTTSKYNFNYLEVPLLAKYKFDMVYINAGPYVGFQLNGSDKFKELYGSKPRTVDLGLQFGAGVAIPAGPGKVIVDGRYALGLSDLSKGPGTVRNRGFNVSLGYAIPLK